MIDEKQYVITMFEKNFENYKSDKIAIYGLGKNTKLLLDVYSNYNIVALMDSVKTGEIVWNLPVIDCETAYKMGIKIILILARLSNVPIIYRRIREECQKYNIAVYDINGERVTQILKKEIEFSKFYERNNKTFLLQKIDNCEVVSFDIFDTLLMRKTLYPTDVFFIVQNKAKKIGLIDDNFDFYKKRINAERELYLTSNPTIHDIYLKLTQDSEITKELAYKLKQLEILEEDEQLVPREEMKNIILYAKKRGKLICCTSDMYLTKEILQSLLRKKNVEGFEDILVSCEYGISKCNGLYDILKSKYPDKKILHIGDNSEADIKMAKLYGINDVFQIQKAEKMLEDSNINMLLEYVEHIDGHFEIGRFIEKQFNNPFLFEKTNGKCNISSCYRMGYDFIEPLVSGFVYWLIEQCEIQHIDKLILGARDGWLIKELLDIVSENHKLGFKYQYVYISRSACTLAGMKSREDVLYASALAFSGTIEEKLKKRFHLQEKDILLREENEDDELYFIRHIEIILENAKKYKISYLKYLNSLEISKSDKIAFFDFVSSGTCQLWLENILEKKIFGFYFMRLYDEYKKKLNIKSLFEPACVYEKQKSKIINNYFFMENIISSPEPSLICIDNEQNLIFEKESRTEKQIVDMREIQQGIIDAFQYRIKNSNTIYVQKEVGDAILSFIHQNYSNIEMDYFKDNILKDEFCNREFELESMVK